MIRNWAISYKSVYLSGSVHCHSGVSGKDIATKEQAIEAFLLKNPSVSRRRIKAFETRSTCETYDELAEWLKAIIEINSREENKKPCPCPKCRYDLMEGTDRIGDSYYCPKCKTLIQTG